MASMKVRFRHARIWLLSLALLFLTLPAGKTLTIRVLQTNFQAQPDFLAATVSTLHKGERVTLLAEQRGWYYVQTSSGKKGYVHHMAVGSGGAQLSGVAPDQRGANDEEVALAAKGFNEENERQVRGNRRSYNFADLDWVMAWNIPVADLAAFVKQGELR
jgi:hypothetical protein